MTKLNHHLRQYRHNDNSGLVFGYEQKGTEVFVSWLEKEIADQKSLAAYAEQRANIAEKANDALVLKNASLNSQAVNQVKMFNEQVDEIAELKAMVDQRIKMLKRSQKD